MFEPASTARFRFVIADSTQKHELVGYMCSNSVWKDGKLDVELHEFFDLMLNTVVSELPKDEPEEEKRLVFVKSVDWWR